MQYWIPEYIVDFSLFIFDVFHAYYFFFSIFQVFEALLKKFEPEQPNVEWFMLDFEAGNYP